MPPDSGQADATPFRFDETARDALIAAISRLLSDWEDSGRGYQETAEEILALVLNAFESARIEEVSVIVGQGERHGG